MFRRHLDPRFHRSAGHGLEEVCPFQAQGAGKILALQLEDHVVPVQSAERLAAAPLDPGHAEHGGLHHISLARELVEQRSKSRHAGLGRLRHVVRLCHTRSVFAPADLPEPVVEIDSTPSKAHLNCGRKHCCGRSAPQQAPSRKTAIKRDLTVSDTTSSTAPPGLLGTARVKRGMAEMLKGGVIMDVVTPEQAKVAEDAGAVAVMALERVPADIRAQGGVSRMSDPDMIDGIIATVSIPVMAKARIGHFAEAQVLQSLGVDYIDESEVLTPADEAFHVDKWTFTVPFVCGATNLGEALRRISEGACMIRSKGEAGTGNIVEAVRHLRSILGDIRKITQADEAEQFEWAKQLRAPLPLVQEIHATGALPVPMFCAGGIATPADAALVMQLGAEAVFVGSGIFKSEEPAKMANAVVEATTHFRDPEMLVKVSRGLGDAMRGEEIDTLDVKLADRGW